MRSPYDKLKRRRPTGLSSHQLQPVLHRQLGSLSGHRPGGTMVRLARRHPDRPQQEPHSRMISRTAGPAAQQPHRTAGCRAARGRVVQRVRWRRLLRPSPQRSRKPLLRSPPWHGWDSRQSLSGPNHLARPAMIGQAGQPEIATSLAPSPLSPAGRPSPHRPIRSWRRHRNFRASRSSHVGVRVGRRVW